MTFISLFSIRKSTEFLKDHWGRCCHLVCKFKTDWLYFKISTIYTFEKEKQLTKITLTHTHTPLTRPHTKVYKEHISSLGSSFANMFLTIQDLKVDQTLIQSENRGVLVSNINIPENEFNNLDSVLERVRNFIITEYSDILNIQYQVCATFELRNRVTGDLRQWTGSFNPKGNQPSALSSFQRFGPTFIEVVKNSTTPDNVYRKLRFYHTETDWIFQKLTSIIISVQSNINLTHATIARRNLLTNHGRRNRSVSSFLLP